MEKMSIEEFELHKKKILDLLEEMQRREANDEYLTEEEEKKFIEEYETNLSAILDKDLSDIPASSWEGLYISQTDNVSLDFSKTRANIDFNVVAELYIPRTINQEEKENLPNFKGCKIENYPFETAIYTPDMFDQEFIDAHPDRFLSLDVPEEIRTRFYFGELTIEDVQTNEEVRQKFLQKHLGFTEGEIYELISREEFLKLDYVFMQETKYWSRDRIQERPELQTAEEIMEYLYETARHEMLSDEDIERGLYGTHLYSKPINLGAEFRRRNPEFFISEEVPEDIKEKFYSGNLEMETYIQNIDYFKGINMSFAFSRYGISNVYKYFGDDMYELFKTYGKYMYKNYFGDTYMTFPEIPSGLIEEKREVIAEVIKKRVEREPIRNLDDVQALSDLIDVETIVGASKYASIISAVGIDRLKELGFTDMEEFKDGISKTETLLELSKNLSDVSLVLPKDVHFSSDYSIEDAARSGIEDVTVFKQDFSQNLTLAKELVDKGVPLTMLSFGTQTIPIRDFINKYGLDNLVKFDEETKLFSTLQRNDKNYQLEVLSIQERNRPYYEQSENPSSYDYETFKSKMYELLVRAREDRGILKSRDFPGYGHMEGKFREEHPEIFIDGASEEITDKFYFGTLTPEDIQKEPNSVEFLKGKDLRLAFRLDINFPGFRTPEGYIVGNAVDSFAGYVCKQYGEDEFLRLCTEYGALICDKTNYFEEMDQGLEDFRNTLEININKAIRGGLEYSEKVPESFKERHPDLFLDETISPEIREKFYRGELRFEDIRKNPELATLLLDKDIDVGFNKFKNNIWESFQTGNNAAKQKYKVFFEKIPKEDVLKLAQKYGRYLLAFKEDDFKEGLTFEELDELVKTSIRREILNRKITYSEDAPEFFKEEHPEFFLSEDAPQLLKNMYYSQQIVQQQTFGSPRKVVHKFSMDALKEHPEFREYLIGKKLNLIKDAWASNLAKEFSTQEILEMVDIDSEGLQLLSGNPKVVETLRRNIDERPNDRENIIKFPGYTLYFSEENREEFDFSEYKELVTMSKFTVSDNYRRGTAEQILATMYDYLGYAGTKEILRLPELEEDRIDEIIRNHGKTFSELYEERFKLKGNLKVLNTLFDKFVPQLPGKNDSLKVYKLLNQKIEEGYDGNLENLLFELMTENNLGFDIEKMKMVSRAAIEINTSEKLELIADKVALSIETEIEETTANKKVLKDILMNIYRKTLNAHETLDENTIREMLAQEFSRTRDDGGTFYSPHITDHLEDLIMITQDLNASQDFGRTINKSVVDILRDEKKQIGQGWIRKLLNLKAEVSKEELDSLNQRLYGQSSSGKVQSTRIVRLKDTSEIGQENAYVFLKELELPGIFTYEKGEQMFAGLSKPYSENFKNFFLKHQKEILRKPEFYTIFQRMHSEFERIIEDPHINTRFKAGVYSLKELLVELNRTTYPDVREGEFELEYVARKAGLETEYWPKAQEVFEKMQERETQTVPPVEYSGKKYRGRILRIDDPLHLVMGNITTCCQRFGRGQPGEPSMLHSALERNGSVFVVEEIDEQGRIVGSPLAQSWTWRNGDRICFDNVEIPDTLETDLKYKKAHDEILTIYMETAKKMMDIDKKMLKKMLDEGRITQEQYDKFVIREITIGTGCDDLIRHLSPEYKAKLQRSNTIRPIEANRSYETATGEMKTPWIDSSTQLILASDEEVKENGKHSSYSGEVEVEYTKIREVLRRAGRNISIDLIKRMKQMQERSGKQLPSVISKLDGNSVAGLFFDEEDYLENENSVVLSQSSNDDWYILTKEEDRSITVLDSVITTGTNPIETQQPIDSKMARYEYLNEMLAIMEIAHQKGKVVRLDQKREGAYIKLEPLFEKGVLINEDGNIKIGNSEEVSKIRKSLSEQIEKGKESRLLHEDLDSESKEAGDLEPKNQDEDGR